MKIIAILDIDENNSSYAEKVGTAIQKVAPLGINIEKWKEITDENTRTDSCVFYWSEKAGDFVPVGSISNGSVICDDAFLKKTMEGGYSDLDTTRFCIKKKTTYSMTTGWKDNLEIVAKTELHQTDHGIPRILYTVSLGNDFYVDVMISGQLEYIMQNEDGTTVIHGQNTVPGYAYNTKEVLSLVRNQYEKDYFDPVAAEMQNSGILPEDINIATETIKRIHNRNT